MARQLRRRYRLAAATTLLLVGPALSAMSPGGTAQAGASDLVLDGRGYGHGVGLSQWGAYGYAVDHGWTAEQILDHYYGGTVAATADVATIRVRLGAHDGRHTAVVHSRPILAVTGAPGQTFRSVVVRRDASGTASVWGLADAAACPGADASLAAPWVPVMTTSSAVEVSATGVDTSVAPVDDLLALCEPSGKVRSYRGRIHNLRTNDGAVRTVNEVALEQYLRSVVASEVSWGWAAAGGGRGAQALRAQAVAARSYALADNRLSYATTCDTTSCQSYTGAAWRSSLAGSFTVVEKAQIDAAVVSTAGMVRRFGSASGAVATTMFSASSGGYTAPTSLGFTPVVDLGDATAANPNHVWSVTVPAVKLQQAYPSIGTFEQLLVTARNGHGEWGGRVLAATVSGSAGAVQVTGDQLRVALGLKSNWFRVRGTGDAPPTTVPPTTVPPTTVPPPGASAGCGALVAPPLDAGEDMASAGFVPMAPSRVVDTRDGTGGHRGQVPAGCTLVVRTGHAGASAAAINVTAVRSAAIGFVTAYRCGRSRPFTSVLQPVAGGTVGGAAVVPLDASGQVCLYTSVSTDLVVDLTGVFRPSDGFGFSTIDPLRRLDTRGTVELPAGSTTEVAVVGAGGVPADAVAAALTVHAISARDRGWATIYPCSAERPLVSSINVAAGGTVANHLEVALSGNGRVCVYVSVSMHLALDVTGWYGIDAPDRYTVVQPTRVGDSRIGLGFAGRQPAGGTSQVTLRGATVPSGATAVIAQVVAVRPAATGFLTVHPCLPSVPAVSMNRYAAGTNVAAAVNGRLSASGAWCFRTSAATDIVIDVTGYFSPE